MLFYSSEQEEQRYGLLHKTYIFLTSAASITFTTSYQPLERDPIYILPTK